MCYAHATRTAYVLRTRYANSLCATHTLREQLSAFIYQLSAKG
ncbi:hypothetical protein [Moorena sp. SIO3B2]|nr:hypothetical protein [Moorena sp. SIO3B2]